MKKALSKSSKSSILTLPLLTLSLFLLLFAMTACGESGNGKENTESSVAAGNLDGGTQTDGDTGDSEEPPEFVPSKETYGEYNFRIIGFGTYDTGWRAMTYCETWVEAINSDPINDAIFERNAKVEELYNITITNVPLSYADRGSHAKAALNYLMSGVDVFDAGLMVAQSMSTILTTPNTTLDLHKVPGLDLSKSWWDQNSIKELSIGGELYAVTGDISLYGAFARGAIAFNKQMAADCELGNIYDLVREGKWTWDKVAELARKASQDIDGDGKIDYRVDQMGLAVGHGSLRGAITSSGEKFALKDSDDMPFINNNQDRIINIIDRVMPIFRDSNSAYVAIDLTRYDNPYFEFIMPQFRDGKLLFYQMSLLNAHDLRGMEMDFGILPAPKLDESQKDYYSEANAAFQTMVWIPSLNEDPERTATILEAMGYYSQQYVIPAFYEVTITNKALRDEDSLEMLRIIQNTVVYDLGIMYNWGDYMSIFESILTKKTFNNTFVSAYEKISEKIQLALETTLAELE